MFPEFKFDPPESTDLSPKAPPLSSKEAERLEELWKRLIKPEERERLERLLLQRLKDKKSELRAMLEEMSGHWHYEDHFYRYYHGSFKVYSTQNTTEKAVQLLRELLPERKLNMAFEEIIREGTGKEFGAENEDAERTPRSILEAFAHAKFMIEMAVRYADLPEPPQKLPSGDAALLYLYDLR
ncbi:MAG TPA: hypothetical protein VGI88_16135 [Verrucomicrobiae bacterium]|jgi:hypothetical protein